MVPAGPGPWTTPAEIWQPAERPGLGNDNAGPYGVSPPNGYGQEGSVSRTGTTAATTGSGARSRPSPVRRQPGSGTPPGEHGRLDMTDGGFGRRLREAVRSPLLLLLVAMAVLAVLV